ncbi:MAG TPA: geranylgeranylglycerol-phosphate geranylgeranyltransferase [Anaerolineae bacterium]|nr:geranylgeranylglycerol-phosphate geranylgeranyltransferase [Anaerolineae bacterium]
MSGLVQITRPHNCLGAALASLLGAYLTGGTAHLLSPSVMRAAIVVGLVVAACNVVNDCRDVTADRVDKPHRPIPSGRVPRRAAGGLALMLALTALGVAWTLGPWPTVIALATTILGVGYSYCLKSTVLLGNGIVGLLSASTVIYGGLAAGDPTPATGVASLLVFLFVFTREILKTIADRRGDVLAGVRTVTTRFGTPASLRLFQILAIVFVVAALAPWFLHLAEDRYLVAMVAGSVLPTVVVAILLGLRLTEDTIHLSLRVTKFLWFSSLFAMVMLK